MGKRGNEGKLKGKGMMETQGKINKSVLPNGWRWVRLGEVCEIVTGSTPRTDDSANWNGEILWATPNDMGKLKGLLSMILREKYPKKVLKVVVQSYCLLEVYY